MKNNSLHNLKKKWLKEGYKRYVKEVFSQEDEDAKILEITKDKDLKEFMSQLHKRLNLMNRYANEAEKCIKAGDMTEAGSYIMHEVIIMKNIIEDMRYANMKFPKQMVDAIYRTLSMLNIFQLQ